MNEIRNTTMLWKRMNYSAQEGNVKKTAGLSQLQSSLNHSLRTVKKKELEFNEDLSCRNFIVHKNKMIRLDSLTLDDRKELVSEIMSSIVKDISRHEDLSKLKDDRSKYAYKLKKFLSKTNEPDILKNLIHSILEAKSNIINIDLIDELNGKEIKRLADKKKALSTYINLHNEIVSAGSNSLHKSKTVIQECFFKFPCRNNINEVKPVDYLRIIYDFHRKFFPEYEIKVCVFHGDEVLSQNHINNGVHPHIFLSAKNSTTGQYDLIKAQLDLVNRFLEEKGEPIIDNKSFKASQKTGETYQRLVYEYVNKRLKEFGYNIEASIHEKTQEHKKKLKEIENDAYKAKIMRSFNLLSQTEQAIKASEEKLNAIKPALEESKKINASMLEQNSNLATKIHSNNITLESQASDIIKAAKKLENIEIQFHQKLIDYEHLKEAIRLNNDAYDAIQKVDVAIDMLAFLNSERKDIKSAFNSYKKKNIDALKKLNQKERIDFLAASSERLKRERLSEVISTNLTLGEKTNLLIHDTAKTVRSIANAIKRKNPKP